MKAARDILVIDDEMVVLQGAERICDSEGLAVDAAASGGAGLAWLDKHDYRLILCDIMMEDLDGFEFLAEARRRGCLTPVVMTTGYSTVENAVRSLQCGAIDYLPKPFTADELLGVLRRGLSYGALHAGDARPCPPGFYWLGYVSWARTEPEGTVLIGVNDLFVRTMKGVRSVELLPVGTDLVQGSSCATFVSSDGLEHGVMCPVSGQVIEAHAEAAELPSTIEEDPYGTGWLYRIVPFNLEHSLSHLASKADTPSPPGVERQGERS